MSTEPSAASLALATKEWRRVHPELRGHIIGGLFDEHAAYVQRADSLKKKRKAPIAGLPEEMGPAERRAEQTAEAYTAAIALLLSGAGHEVLREGVDGEQP